MQPTRRRLLRALSLLAFAGRAPALPRPSLTAPNRRADGTFFQPWGAAERGLGDLLRWKLAPKPYDKRGPLAIPVRENDPARLRRRAPQPEITWIGHATFAIHDEREVVLTDPHFGPRAFLPRRLSAPGLPLSAVPAGAVALLSHNHYDHLDEWTVARLPREIVWLVPLGLGAFVRARGGREVRELGWWESVRRGRWTFTCLPAQHWSRRLGQPRNSTLWCSWLADSGERRFFFAGDSGYFHGFAELGRELPPVDVALLPIGAYEPRWFMAPVHMDPGEALDACRDLGARFALPMHWGAFDLTDEPADLPPQVWREQAAARGLAPERVPLLAVGETWQLPG